MTRQTDRLAPWRAGRDAAYAGASALTCPYADGTQDAATWLAGYRRGERMDAGDARDAYDIAETVQRWGAASW